MMSPHLSHVPAQMRSAARLRLVGHSGRIVTRLTLADVGNCELKSKLGAGKSGEFRSICCTCKGIKSGCRDVSVGKT